MMKKVGFIFLFVFLVVCGSSAQSVRTHFLNMPDSITPLLTSVNKADFLDFIDSKMEAKVKNKLDGNSIMKELTEDYLFIQMSSSSSFEIKILPHKKSQILAVVETVSAPVKNSYIKFYDADWNLLPTDEFFTFPTLSSFIIETIEKDLFRELVQMVDVGFFELNLCPESTVLEVRLTSIDYLNKEQIEKFSDSVVRCLEYSWDKKRFSIK